MTSGDVDNNLLYNININGNMENESNTPSSYIPLPLHIDFTNQPTRFFINNIEQLSDFYSDRNRDRDTQNRIFQLEMKIYQLETKILQLINNNNLK